MVVTDAAAQERTAYPVPMGYRGAAGPRCRTPRAKQ
ncbi:hypothetical protein [Streptomyces sp. NBC_00268]|nr:hypothetical protein [Streptomyces sp. NBC_00268]